MHKMKNPHHARMRVWRNQMFGGRGGKELESWENDGTMIGLVGMTECLLSECVSSAFRLSFVPMLDPHNTSREQLQYFIKNIHLCEPHGGA